MSVAWVNQSSAASGGAYGRSILSRFGLRPLADARGSEWIPACAGMTDCRSMAVAVRIEAPLAYTRLGKEPPARIEMRTGEPRPEGLA